MIEETEGLKVGDGKTPTRKGQERKPMVEKTKKNVGKNQGEGKVNTSRWYTGMY